MSFAFRIDSSFLQSSLQKMVHINIIISSQICKTFCTLPLEYGNVAQFHSKKKTTVIFARNIQVVPEVNLLRGRVTDRLEEKA